MDTRDIDWFVPLVIVAALELFLAWSLPLGSLFPKYLELSLVAVLIFGFAAVPWIVVAMYRCGEQQPIRRIAGAAWDARTRFLFAAVGLLVVTTSSCAITALKSGISASVPFYADPTLAQIDRAIFGEDAWRWTNRVFGWASSPVTFFYETWLVGQVWGYTALLFSAPSRLKAQALTAHAFMWFLLGVVLAYAFSSAGPVFYDQVFGVDDFAGLSALLGTSGYTADASRYLWEAHASGSLQFAAGISAMPSLHVAGATWLGLIVATAKPRLSIPAWAYVVMIYLGSIMTGWHYALDGVVGFAGAILLWKAAAVAIRWRELLPPLANVHTRFARAHA